MFSALFAGAAPSQANEISEAVALVEETFEGCTGSDKFQASIDDGYALTIVQTPLMPVVIQLQIPIPRLNAAIFRDGSLYFICARPACIIETQTFPTIGNRKETRKRSSHIVSSCSLEAHYALAELLTYILNEIRPHKEE